MGRLINKPVSVTYQPDQGPLSFLFEGIAHPVLQVVETWKDTGAWWDGEKEKIFYRVQVRKGTLSEVFCEIYSEDNFSQWFLYKIYD